MYSNSDLEIQFSYLVKIPRLEVNQDCGYSAFTLKEVFIFEVQKNDDLSIYSMILKKN